MYGLLSTTDMMWFFFIFWQMMTLPGYALIRFEYKKPENIRAANKFLVMMQIACAATMIGAELLASAARRQCARRLKYDFDTVSAQLPALLAAHPGPGGCCAFALFLIGFGIKMGMWPFGQFWLPDAHPAAPSPVSAMLSGVMIKTGVYGLMRYFLWLMPAGGARGFPAGRMGLGRGGAGHHHAVHRHDAGAEAGTDPSGCWPFTASARLAISFWVSALAWLCCRRQRGRRVGGVGLLRRAFSHA